jgi:hypothetical protein
MSCVSIRVQVANDFSCSLLRRDGLMAYLRPFASEGKVVSKDDVTRFFEERRVAAEAARKGAGH